MTMNHHVAAMEKGQRRFKERVIPLPMESMDLRGGHDQIRHPRLALGSPGMNQEQEVARQIDPILVRKSRWHSAGTRQFRFVW
jgi:hypothetical protein